MPRLTRYKLRANALQFVVYIVVVVAVLLSMLLLYIHLNNKLIAQSNAQIEAIELANQGIYESLNKNLTYQDTLIQEFENQKSCKLLKQHWGVFNLVKSFAKVRDKTFQKIALVGGETPFTKDLALYIQDNNQALVLVGDTNIKGSVYLGTYGAKPGQISGIGYTNNQLIYGNTSRSRMLPNLAIENQSYIKSIESKFLNDSVTLNYFDVDKTNRLSQSFFQPTAFYISNQKISLFAKNYAGKVIIQSKQKIYVDASSNLKNVILIAPSISIGENFKGALQAFATDQIEVASGVTLDYPSVLLLNPKDNFRNSNIPKITIEPNTEINAAIAYLKGSNPQLENNVTSHIHIKENAIVNGQIFSSYNLNLEGQVFGHVITNQFLTPYRGSYYINHVFNVNMASKPVSLHFSGLLFQSNLKNIALWLN